MNAIHPDLTAPNPPTGTLGQPTISEHRTHQIDQTVATYGIKAQSGLAPAVSRSTPKIKHTSRPRLRPFHSGIERHLFRKEATGGDSNERGASPSPDTMSQEPSDNKPTAPEETTIDGDDDLSEEYDDAVRQTSEPDGDWKMEWLDANKDKLLSVMREEERILATGTPT
ncbi:hypothetical protein pdul_cds_693 [Pandoravirus dulcis]|uniref:Uncharacterized protein n=1 Tax=Pandoravirus dulcis TaxID=1349409 RepID=S4VTU6_9VIRU|nr:hypothetical protein pdul_cds_693 [Pandoravirus dulcis]AGO82845.1 hypothetical protein pdul_cds_693 [Pandoravirus dulcis]